jgi:hypothetical protein
MLGLLLPLVVTSVVGALWVGSFAGLQRLRIDWWPLALGSIAVQLVLFNPPIDRQPWALAYGPWIWVLSLVGMLVVLVRNSGRIGPARYAFVLAAVGVAANLFVVVANGGYMPQSVDARMVARGIPLTVEGDPPRLLNVAPAGPETHFAWLGDVIAQPTWLPTANVVSVGDLALSLALAWWALQMTTSHKRAIKCALAQAVSAG